MTCDQPPWPFRPESPSPCIVSPWRPSLQRCRPVGGHVHRSDRDPRFKAGFQADFVKTARINDLLNLRAER